ncbi:hypothetical protein [Niallia taxi]|uniref:hypothetical protein n=1 Tax=Niallia taxi TaxID=2499688 RepID=UPI00300921B2
MTEVKTKLERDQLVQLIQNRTKWSEHSLRAFKDESLQEIYKYIVEGYSIHKAKIMAVSGSYVVKVRIPKPIVTKLSLSYGDYFALRANVINKELILDPNYKARNSVKMVSDNTIHLPGSIIDKNLLRKNDDVLVRVDDEGRIILKSFTFYQ